MIRFENLNTLRAISIIFIIVGHICLQLGYEPIGRFFGYLFVQIFFLLSAYLLGLKYGEVPLTEHFLVNRWKKISYTYYPFLFVSIIVLSLLFHNVSAKSVFLHLSYVNYIIQDHLDGTAFGHLWYISMQMLCYVFITLMCRRRILLFLKKLSIFNFVILSLFILALCIFGYYFGIPCRIFIILYSYLLIFTRAKCIKIFFLNYTKEKNQKTLCPLPFITKKGVVISLFFVACNAWCLYMFLFCNLSNRLLFRDLMILITSVSWFFFFMCVVKDTNCLWGMSFVSSISFELYLVHHPFVLGQYSLFTDSLLFKSIWINGVFAIVVVFVLAYFLHVSTKLFSVLFSKKSSLC